MIPLLLHSTKSFFIPLDMTNRVVLKTMSLHMALDLSFDNDTDLVVALSASKNISNLATQFSSLSTLYNESCKFVLTPFREIRKHFNSNKKLNGPCPPKPCIVIIRKGEIVDYAHVKNADFLAGGIENFLNPDKELASDQTDLVRSLGYTPFTIVCNEQQFNKAQSTAREMTRTYSPVSVKLATKEALKSTGLEDGQFALYRHEDQEILIFDGSIREFKKNVIPTYHQFTRNEILKTNKTIIAWTGYATSSEHKKIFGELGMALHAEKIFDFEFGFIDREDIPEFAAFVGASDFDIDNISVFNVRLGYTYSTDSFFKNFPDHKLNTTKWVQPLADYIMSIKNGNLKPHYLNEEVSNEAKDALIKLNRESYKDFINDKENDVVIFYVRPFCATCRRFLRRFKEFAEFYPKAPVGPVKFGFIDISRNGLEYDYPPRVMDPHLVLFRRNETGHDGLPLLGAVDEASLRRAISVFGSSGDSSYQGRPFLEVDKVNETVAAALERIPQWRQSSVKRAHEIFLRSLLPVESGEWRADPLTAEVNMNALSEEEREAVMEMVKKQQEMDKAKNAATGESEDL